jgi:3-methyladenine DNA glycosylase AlkC
VERRGARKIADVPPSVTARLETGLEQSANHVEQMALDMPRLLRSVLPGLVGADQAGEGGFLSRMRTAARLAYNHLGADLFRTAPKWPSDTARGWAAFALVLEPNLTLEEQIHLAIPFADDAHFAVREWAWLGLRPAVVASPLEAIAALKLIVESPSARLRRFACEATRPRGVWSSHIPLLKAEPWHGRPILDPLATDSERYVQDSVANWVNDGAKGAPLWAQDVCLEWQRSGSVPQRVLVKAGRSLSAEKAAR